MINFNYFIWARDGCGATLPMPKPVHCVHLVILFMEPFLQRRAAASAAVGEVVVAVSESLRPALN